MAHHIMLDEDEGEPGILQYYGYLFEYLKGV
jgi:hypothetical protein